MSKLKSLSRAGWVIVGLVAAMLLVPTMAVAATVSGRSGDVCRSCNGWQR